MTLTKQLYSILRSAVSSGKCIVAAVSLTGAFLSSSMADTHPYNNTHYNNSCHNNSCNDHCNNYAKDVRVTLVKKGNLECINTDNDIIEYGTTINIFETDTRVNDELSRNTLIHFLHDDLGYDIVRLENNDYKMRSGNPYGCYHDYNQFRLYILNSGDHSMGDKYFLGYSSKEHKDKYLFIEYENGSREVLVKEQLLLALSSDQHGTKAHELAVKKLKMFLPPPCKKTKAPEVKVPEVKAPEVIDLND